MYLFPLFELKDEEIFQAGRHIFMHTYISDRKAFNKVCNICIYHYYEHTHISFLNPVELPSEITIL